MRAQLDQLSVAPRRAHGPPFTRCSFVDQFLSLGGVAALAAVMGEQDGGESSALRRRARLFNSHVELNLLGCMLAIMNSKVTRQHSVPYLK